jgi:hypothetical protein
MTQHNEPPKEPSKDTYEEHIGDYTVTWNRRGIEITQESTICAAFSPDQAWDLIDFLHDRQHGIYRQLQEAGLRAYPAAESFLIYQPCCDYIYEGLIRRAELVEFPEEDKPSKGDIVAAINEYFLEDARKQDQKEGWPLSPQDPITPHWTRVNGSTILCASKITADYGLRRPSTWQVQINYGELGEERLAIHMGFWLLRHPEANDQQKAEARQSIKQRLGFLQGTETYAPEAFLKWVSAWDDAEGPAILEYDATNSHPQQIGQHLVVAKLYRGGSLKPWALVYRTDS